jgi:hypothetical protein
VVSQYFLENTFNRISGILSKDNIQKVRLPPRKAARLLGAVDDDKGLAYVVSLANVTRCMLCKPVVPSRLELMNTSSHPTTGEIGCGGT